MGKINLMNLSDDLLCSQILTRLPLKEAVRFSAVSRKWCKAWTRLPHLKFSDEFFDSVCTDANMQADIINKIILMQCVHLETFELYHCNWFESSIHKWVLWTSLLGVECINLKGTEKNIFQNHGEIPKEVSESIFSCMTLRSLSLDNFKMTQVPALSPGHSQLVTLYLEWVELSEQAFGMILKFCERLQNLTAYHCLLPSSLRIISSSLKSLSLFGCWDKISSMEANCPRLESIKFTEFKDLVKGNICLPMCVHLETDFQFLEHFVAVTSLRKIKCVYGRSFGKILQSFPHLEEFCLDSPIFYPDDPGDPTLQLANLETFIVNIGLSNVEGYADEYPEKYDMVVSLCACVLKRAPHLKTVRIRVDYSLETFKPGEFYDFLQFFDDFLCLVRDFPTIKFSVSSRIVRPDEQ